MADSLNITVTSKTGGTQQSTEAFGVTYNGAPNLSYVKVLGATVVSKLFFNNYSVSGTTVLNLTDGSLVDAFGTPLVYSAVKSYQVINRSTANNVVIGGGSQPLFPALPSLTAGGCYSVTTNLAVVSGSAHNFQLVAVSGTVSCDVMIVGA